MITGPKNAVPTLRGWVSKTGELLKAQKISQADVDDWYAAAEPAPKIEQVADVVYNTPEPEAVEEVVEEEVEEEAADVVYSSPAPKKRKKRFGGGRIAKAVEAAKDKITNN